MLTGEVKNKLGASGKNVMECMKKIISISIFQGVPDHGAFIPFTPGKSATVIGRYYAAPSLSEN